MKVGVIENGLTTRALGRKLVALFEVDSTNKHASRLFKEGKLQGGMVFIATKQTEGRGRLEREWFSDGGLAMTIVLEMEKPVSELGGITLTAGVAATMALSELTGKSFHVKYPNDIMYEGRKVGGILSELKMGAKPFVLIGIGINVEQTTFPKEIENIAVSLRQAGTDVTIEETATAIINKLELMIDLFNKGFSYVRPHWIEHNCTLGKMITVSNPAGNINGKAINLDDEGNLILETADGIVKTNAGDFTILEN